MKFRLVRTSGSVAMKEFKLAPSLAATAIAVVTATALFGSFPLRAQAPSAAAAHIQT